VGAVVALRIFRDLPGGLGNPGSLPVQAVAGLADRPVEPFERPAQRLGLEQRFAKIPRRVGVRDHAAGPGPQTASGSERSGSK